MSQSQGNVRTRVACKHCNSRRVRCDRSPFGGACSNCQLSNTVCELINSQRGKHKRSRQKKRQDEPSSHITDSSPALESTLSSPLESRASEQPSGRARNQNRYVSPSLPDFVIDKEGGNSAGKVVYMGDSGNMKYVIDEVGDPFKTSPQSTLWGDNLQRFMMEKLGRPTQLALKHLRSEDEHYLRNLGAFHFPDKHVSDDLIRGFFEYSYPVFPIFNRAEFMTAYSTGRLSPLVLNAVYCVAAIHCSVATLAGLGFTSRYLACFTFYRHAKALYERDYETDGIATIQAVILMMNWWGGPMEQKDTWHWLGVATGLAQSLGLHRSKSYAILPPLQLRLWRRIWWVLFVNDIHHAAVFGRPPHIHSQFCDVKPLTLEDMSDDNANTDSEGNVEGSADYDSSSNESKLYLVHLAHLASRVSNCIIAKFSPDEDARLAQSRYQDLLAFEATLPSSFRSPLPPPQLTRPRGFWPSMLHLQYWDYQIVFHRMLSDAPDEGATFAIAGRISRALEDLLASGTLYGAPFLAFPAIFCSILVHIITIRKRDAHVRVVAEHRARLAMHILENFQDAWPIVIWTRHLLDVLLKGSTAGPGGTGLALGNGGGSGGEQDSRHTQMGGVEVGNASHGPGAGVDGGASSPERSPVGHHADPYPIAADAAFPSIPLMFPLDSLVQDAGLSADLWPDDYSNLEEFM